MKPMDLLLKGLNGFVTLRIKKTVDFPNRVNRNGGYDTVSTIILRTNEFSTIINIPFSTHLFFEFYQKIKLYNFNTCDQITLTSDDKYLQLSMSYNDLNTISIKMCIFNRYNSNIIIKFELETDKARISDTYLMLKNIVRSYWPLEGVVKKIKPNNPLMHDFDRYK